MMALPITHYLYLGLALFCVGLAGALLRRSLIVVLLGVELMLGAVALLFCAYARFFGDSGGQLVALIVVLVGLVELAVVVAVVLRMRASPGLLDDWTGGGSNDGGEA